MTDGAKGEVTSLLEELSDGDRGALDRLVPLVQAELRRIARNQLRRKGACNTLQPTELIHEAYLKLMDQTRTRWKERRQFYAIAARLMRRILVDHARSRGAKKRGGQAACVTLVTGEEPSAAPSFDSLAVHEALDRLSKMDARQAELVELRFFGGLTFEESAAVLGISLATAKRGWVHARARLYRELRS